MFSCLAVPQNILQINTYLSIGKKYYSSTLYVRGLAFGSNSTGFAIPFEYFLKYVLNFSLVQLLFIFASICQRSYMTYFIFQSLLYERGIGNHKF